MRRYLMFGYCSACILAVLLLQPVAPLDAAGGDYGRSVHSDGSLDLWDDSPVGVKRSSLSYYKEGNCAHCHEQHSSVAGIEPDDAVAGTGPDDFLLFSPSDANATASSYSVADNFCFQCHSDNSVQQGGIINYDYSGTFDGFIGNSGSGGASPTSIMGAFNKAHSHDLQDVYNHALANFPWFKTGSNACTACHNPHLVQRNTKIVSSSGNLQTVMSLPAAHTELYGDEATETMSRYTPLTLHGYVPPNGEPTIAQTPDYNTFCLTCHVEEVASNSGAITIDAVDWTTDGSPDGDGNQVGVYDPPGDKHGINRATAYAAVDPPFNVNGTSNTPGDIVLSCLNCHEAHGAENNYMTRRSINNLPLGAVIAGISSVRGVHCVPCHMEDMPPSNHWQNTHHDAIGEDNPYDQTAPRDGYSQAERCRYCHEPIAGGGVMPIACEDCHFHGSYVDEYDKHSVEGAALGVKYVKPDYEPYRRKTF